MNTAEMLDKDGLVVDGPASFYCVPGFPGIWFFSEDVDEKPDTYVLDMALTCIVVPALGPHGEQGFRSFQAMNHIEVLFAKTIYAPKKGTTRFNSTNPILYENCRKNASAVRMRILTK